MAFRARKSVKIGPGLRLTASKTGIGLSAGTRGARYSVHSSGRRTTSVGVPGTGVGYTTSRNAGSGSSRRARSVAAPPTPAPKPGLLAPGYEKAFYKAVQAYIDGKAEQALALFRDATIKDANDKVISDDFFAGMISAQTDDDAAAIELLEKVVSSPIALPDALMDKYIQGGSIKVGVTESVSVEVPFGTLAAALTLAECYQRAGRRDEAIGLIGQLHELDPDPALLLSLCDLLAEAGAWDEIVDLAAGTRNDDDASLQVVLLQARALVEQGMVDPAIEVCKEALRSKKREPILLTEARYLRGRLYAQAGKKAQAKKDLAQVYADDPKFEDVAELLATLE